MEPKLTTNQQGRFEHHIKVGTLETLHRQGLLTDLVFMEAVRIQNQKDQMFFADDDAG
jgi:hypothetical protein